MNESKMLQKLEASGFDGGDLFEDDNAVRDYFTLKNFERVFGWIDDETPTQEELCEMADYVIEQRLHMK
jgi:hypothetical protein